MQTLTQPTDWTPHSNWLRVLRCTGAEVEEVGDQKFYWQGGVCVPEHIGDTSNQAIVLDAGPLCEELRREEVREAAESGKHLRLWIKENCHGLHRIQGEEFVIREDNEGIIPLAIQE